MHFLDIFSSVVRSSPAQFLCPNACLPFNTRSLRFYRVQHHTLCAVIGLRAAHPLPKGWVLDTAKKENTAPPPWCQATSLNINFSFFTVAFLLLKQCSFPTFTTKDQRSATTHHMCQNLRTTESDNISSHLFCTEIYL